ncbi:NUDIX hydrolase [Rhizobium laguerreae]|uniref:NUDIX hydrolase n=1 Tax=Rhizobium laguerreae TaxID=1076926 RepID=UPI001FE7CEEF|nr:NUDIX hydrolase [Rhizobium laguerreae]
MRTFFHSRFRASHLDGGIESLLTPIEKLLVGPLGHQYGNFEAAHDSFQRGNGVFQDQAFSIPADHIDCQLVGNFELQDRVEEVRKSTWAAVCAKRPAAFDGSLLRMASYQVDGERLSIAASRTRFSAYVATRHPAFASEHPHADRADPLGLTAIVLTADGNVIVTKRSLLADQNPGGLYLIGGYAEPGDSDGPVDIFNEIAREVEEEIAVGDVSRSEAVAIGLAYDPVFCHPELFLLMPSKSTAADILSGADAAPDRNEASELLFYSVDDILDDNGPHKNAALTWSFIKARKFLQLHLR